MLFVLAISFGLSSPTVSVAQRSRTVYVNQYSAYPWVGSVYAQAALIRSQGEAAVDYQTARNLAAEAFDKELDNALKTVKIYFERRAVRDAEVLKNHLDEADKQKEAELRRIVDHPDLSGEAEVNGKALNSLKKSLSNSILSFSYIEGDYPGIDQLISQFDLTTNDLSKIQLRLRNTGGNSPIFSADTGQIQSLTWWAFLLRDQKFFNYRTDLNQQMTAIIKHAQSNGDIPNTMLDTLHNTVLEFSQKFLEPYTYRTIFDPAVFRQKNAAELHLRGLDRMVQRMKEAGKSDGTLVINDYSPTVDGKNLTSLLAYMVRNGVEFAPPEPGDESVYQKLFEMNKTLYVVAADFEY
ncbi:MAG: hypothetical protein ACKVH8_20635 [Pirellulales bacterium]